MFHGMFLVRLTYSQVTSLIAFFLNYPNLENIKMYSQYLIKICGKICQQNKEIHFNFQMYILPLVNSYNFSVSPKRDILYFPLIKDFLFQNNLWP